MATDSNAYFTQLLVSINAIILKICFVKKYKQWRYLYTSAHQIFICILFTIPHAYNIEKDL